MVSNYVKSPGRPRRIQENWPRIQEVISDDQYDEYLNQTRKSPKDKTLVEIRMMTRVLLLDGSQYIVHDHADIRFDLIGNIKMWYRGGIGKYPIPTPHFEIKVDEETLEKSRVCTRADYVKTGYSIKFSQRRPTNYTNSVLMFRLNTQVIKSLHMQCSEGRIKGPVI